MLNFDNFRENAQLHECRRVEVMCLGSFMMWTPYLAGNKVRRPFLLLPNIMYLQKKPFSRILLSYGSVRLAKAQIIDDMRHVIKAIYQMLCDNSKLQYHVYSISWRILKICWNNCQLTRRFKTLKFWKVNAPRQSIPLTTHDTMYDETEANLNAWATQQSRIWTLGIW